LPRGIEQSSAPSSTSRSIRIETIICTRRTRMQMIVNTDHCDTRRA
jgi:hypothetical protein